MHLHHLVSRAQLGDDVAANLVPLCARCHERVTEHRPIFIGGLMVDPLPLVAESLTDAEYAYCVGKLGESAMQRLFGV
jgi:hypothetical protein